MASRTSRRRNLFSVLGLVAIAVLFVAVVLVSENNLRSARVDLTEHRLYTLSSASEQVIEEIDEPITLHFYYSSRLGRELPSIGTYASRVRDILEEYAALSEGKICLQMYDPEPFTDAEDRAVSLGLQGVPVDQTGELVYFGLAGTNATDDREVIPFFDQSREQFLEFDVTRMLHNLANPDRPEVGMISSLPLSGTPQARRAPDAPDDSWVVWQQLSQQFDMEVLGQNVEAIPDSLDLLVIVHPTGLTEDAYYAIDQYLMNGGRLLAFVDPHNEADSRRPGRPPGQMEAGSNLSPLFDAWGVEMPADQVVGDANAGRRVQVPTKSGTRAAAVDYPLWMGLNRQHFAADDPTTAQLNSVRIASPGHLALGEDAAVELTPLIRTSESGGIVDVTTVQGGSREVLNIANRFEPSGTFTLAARLRGDIPSAFPDGPPKPPEVQEAEAALQEAEDENARAEARERLDEVMAEWEQQRSTHVAESSIPLEAIVVADADMLVDGFWVQVQDFFGQRITVPTAQNGQFVVNAADNLTGSEALIALRSRGSFQRPFTLIQSIQREAERQFRAKEQELLAELAEAERKLGAIEPDDPAAGATVLTEGQRMEIERFRDEIVRIRGELRTVQYQLRRDVEAVKDTVRAANIGLMPALVALVAIGLAMGRRITRRRAARRRTAA